MTAKQAIPTAASDEPEYEIDSFELLWEKHKTQIIGGAIAAIVILVAVFGWFIITNARRSAAETAFSGAKTAADYRKVIEDYSSSPVAGDAALLLAKSLRDEKKYDDANAVLNNFVKTQPKHPFAPLAKVAVAENLALAGKTDDAEKALEAVAQSDSSSFAAPYALLLAAELKTAQGQRDAAIRIYRSVQSSYPESISTRVSASAAEALSSVAGPSAPPAPAKK